MQLQYNGKFSLHYYVQNNYGGYSYAAQHVLEIFWRVNMSAYLRL